MLRVMLVATALLSLGLAHWTGGGGGLGGSSGWTGTGSWGGSAGGGRSRQANGYCRDRHGYLYRCDDTSWGSGSRWNNNYGRGGYYDRARYVGRGRVRYRGRGDSAELVCDFRRDARLSYGQTIQNVVWKKVRNSYRNGGSGCYSSSSSHSSGQYGSTGCGGSRYYPSYPSYPSGPGSVAGWVTTDGDVSTLTLLYPSPYDAGQYRCIAQLRSRYPYGRDGDIVYMEVDYRGSNSGGSWGDGGGGGWGGGWGGSGGSGWGGSGGSGWGGSGGSGWGGSGGSGWGGSGGGGWSGSGGGGGGGGGGWGGSGWGYRRSALKKTQPDRVVSGDDSNAGADTRLKTDGSG